MPCRDYESDNWSYDNSREVAKLKKQADKLARIACKAMDALEESGIEDLLLLKDDEVREWWLKHKEADRKERERVAEKERKERIKAEALARLSAEEKEVLGLAPKVSAKKKYSGVDSRTVVADMEADMDRVWYRVMEAHENEDEDEA